MKLLRLWMACAIAGTLLAGCSKDHKPDYKLNVPSPEWQDQIVYFVMTDRFNDGDPTNDDQRAGEYDPADGRKYSGGDLKGLADRLDYVKGLGATAVWITPPVANQWWDPHVNYGGYHGYWARDFKAVDRHLGTLDDYKALSDKLHRNGMYLIQDVVVNHMANCFWYDGYDPADPTKHVVVNTGAVPACGPARAPFDRWNPSVAGDFAAHVFHWTPPISDYTDRNQQLDYQLSDLDDLDTENPQVVAALKDSYAYWIKEVGVDAFRIDTAMYVPQAFFKSWYRDGNGIDAAARATGRTGFLAFGEGYVTDGPYADANEQFIESYMTDAGDGSPLLPSMLEFPMYRTSGDVFARGHATAELGYRMQRAAALHGARWHVMPTFVDNHDVDRFLGGGTVDALRQNLLFLMTTPGIPVIYQGTEQGFTAQRASMFKGGNGSDGADHFDTTHPLYRFIAEVAKLRTDNAVLRRGEPAVLKSTSGGPGAFVYSMAYQGQIALVLFNTSESEVLVDNVATGLPPGAQLHLLYSLQPGAADLVAGAGGALTLPLAGREGRVYLATGGTTTVPNPGALTLTVPGGDGSVQHGDFTVSGTTTVPDVAQALIVVDGDLAHAAPAAVTDGAFHATVDTSAMFDKTQVHTVTAYVRSVNLASATTRFTNDVPFVERVAYTDPSGDDTGPSGKSYGYPTDGSWGTNRQMDLTGVKIQTAGRTLRLQVSTHQVTNSWNPQNGFDHVAFTIFIQVPGQANGVTVMPQQAGTVPTGMAWNYRARVHGWSNALFSSAGASASSEGTPVAPASLVSVDRATNTVQFTILPAALGGPATLDGVKVYVTTWDYDGGYRAFATAPAPWQFSGGVEGTDPKVMDDTPVLTIPPTP